MTPLTVVVGVKVYVPTLLTLSPLNVATPFVTVTGPPPVSVAPPGVVSARVTVPLAVVTTLPLASSTVAAGAGLIVAAATTALGCCVQTTWLGAPALTAKLLETWKVVTPATVVLGVDV